MVQYENVARAGQTARRRLPPLVRLLANKIGCEIKAAFAALVESVSDFAERLRPQNTALLDYASPGLSRRWRGKARSKSDLSWKRGATMLADLTLIERARGNPRV